MRRLEEERGWRENMDGWRRWANEEDIVARKIDAMQEETEIRRREVCMEGGGASASSRLIVARIPSKGEVKG